MAAFPDPKHLLHGPRAEWPGPSASGAVILPLEPERFATFPASIRVDDREFARKHEFHLTLLSRAQWQAVRKFHGAKKAREVFESLDWRLQGVDRYWLAHSPTQPRAWTIVLGVHAAALEAMRAQLRCPGVDAPAPHVTIYQAGSRTGIGMSDPAQWRERVVGELSMDWLHGLAVTAGGPPGEPLSRV